MNCARRSGWCRCGTSSSSSSGRPPGVLVVSGAPSDRPKDQPVDEVKGLLYTALDQWLAETNSDELGPELMQLMSALQTDLDRHNNHRR